MWVGYMHVSPNLDRPKTDLQRDALLAPALIRVTSSRITPRTGRMTTPAWRGRSLSHLFAIVTSLKHNRVVFRSLTENLDTTTRSGEFLFQVRRARAV